MSTEQKHIIIGIRYSLLVNNPIMWSIGADIDFDSYKDKVLSPKRLATREAIFQSICLPSLVNINKNIPQNVNFKVVIMASALLPVINKSFLEKIETEHSFIEIVYRSPDEADVLEILSQSIESTVKEGEMYASVRLDDDDALSLDWLNQTLGYIKPHFSNMVISLVGGFAALVDENGKMKSLANYKWRFASAGQSYICMKDKNMSKSVYHCGKHSFPEDNHQTIIYAKGKCVLRTFNDFNDSKVDFPNKKIIEPKNWKIALKDYF